MDVIFFTHRSDSLSPYRFRWRLGVEEIAGHEDVSGFMVASGIGQARDCGMSGFDQATTNLFWKITETTTEMEIGSMDEAKCVHLLILDLSISADDICAVNFPQFPRRPLAISKSSDAIVHRCSEKVRVK
jgi:hypothetical protein